MMRHHKIRAPREDVEQENLVLRLRVAGLHFHASLNGVRLPAAEASRQARMGMKAGVSDLLITSRVPSRPEVRFLALEMKRADPSLSSWDPEQKLWAAEVEADGGIYLLAYGCQDALRQLRLLGFGV
jgi:hypothetical protein